MSEKYWIVRMDVFAFDTKEEAITYQDALTDAFCAMPESKAYASSLSIIEEDCDDEGK